MANRIRALFGVSAALFCCVGQQAHAFNYIEATDLPNSSSFGDGVSVGTLAGGLNTASGRLAANCVSTGAFFDCNPASAVDGQDSFLFTVPDGRSLTSITIRASTIGTLPPGFNFSFDLRNPSFDFLQVSGMTPGPNYTFAADLGPGVYSASVFGGTASAAGAYSIAWSVDFTGSGAAAVPESTTWALMIAGFGVMGGAMRRRPARSAMA